METQGSIFLVGTPIGNLEDITLRAIKTLEQVDLIATEDTRRTKILLSHYKINAPVISYYKYNKTKRLPQILSYLKEGKNVAVVSDAGMPGVSDCGAELINLALKNNIKVDIIPGPTAFLTALILSNIPSENFLFLGFLPKKKSALEKFLQNISSYPQTLVFYCGKSKVLETLFSIRKILGDRKIAVAKELTKLHQEFFRGKIDEVIEILKNRNLFGEYTIVIEGNKIIKEKNIDISDSLKQLIEQGYTKKDAVKKISEETGISKNKIYKASLTQIFQ